MAKKCWICKNTEEFLLKQKEDILSQINEKIQELENNNSKIIEITKEKLGFSDEMKDKVKNIQSVYAEMTLNAVLENRSNFITLEPSFQILFDYVDKYFYTKKNISTVKDLINMFLQEPIEDRYRNEVNSNSSKIRELKIRKEKIESIKTFFIEKDISAAKIDNIKNKLFDERNLKYNSDFGFIPRINRNEQKNIFQYSLHNLGFLIEKKIYICPICLSLLGEASLSSFEIREAQKNAQEAAYDDDWGDEDDM